MSRLFWLLALEALFGLVGPADAGRVPSTKTVLPPSTGAGSTSPCRTRPTADPRLASPTAWRRRSWRTPRWIRPATARNGRFSTCRSTGPCSRSTATTSAPSSGRRTRCVPTNERTRAFPRLPAKVAGRRGLSRFGSEKQPSFGSWDFLRGAVVAEGEADRLVASGAASLPALLLSRS